MLDGVLDCVVVVAVAVGGGAGAVAVAVEGVEGVDAGAVAEAALSVFGATLRRDDGKTIGVTTMTSAINTSASTVRLSMQTEGLAKEPDHTRPVERGDSVQCVALPTNSHEEHRASGALRWHTLNSLDNNGTRREESGTA